MRRPMIDRQSVVGIALAALASALIGVLVFISNDQQLRELTFWTMGGLGGATWPKIAAVLPLMPEPLFERRVPLCSKLASTVGNRSALALAVCMLRFVATLGLYAASASTK